MKMTANEIRGTALDIDGAIFDIDGVLLDSMEIWTDLGARYVRSCQKCPQDGLGEILFNMSMEQGAEWLRDHYLPEKSTEEITEGIQDMLRDYYFYEVQAKQGAKELLKMLQTSSVRITAATSSPREHVEKALKRNGLLAYIERIFTSTEVGSSKHSPEIYDAAAAHMGLERKNIFVFEDSLYALRTAAKAGYRTVGVYDRHGEPDQQGLRETAEIYVRDLNAFLGILQKI